MKPEFKKCADNDTPLLTALRKGHDEAAIVLLDAGANPNAVNNKGQTPLMLAVDNADPIMVDKLLRAGALIDNPQVANSRQNLFTLAKGWHNTDAETEEKFAAIRELLDRASPAQVTSFPAKPLKL